MYKNILLPYSFENDFDNIPENLAKLVGEDSTVVVHNVMTENDLLASVRYENKHKEDIIKEKEEELSQFLEKLKAQGINYKVALEFGPVKDSILERISFGDLDVGDNDVVVMSNYRVSIDIIYVLGVVMHHVAKRSTVPILIVK